MSIAATESARTERELPALRLTAGVVCEAGADYCVVVGTRTQTARRAASCLVQPQVGDTVLIARGDDMHWIVSVLVGAGQREVHLQGPRLVAQAGEISLEARDMRTTSAQWNASHAQLDLAAGTVRGRVGVLDWLGERVHACMSLFFSRSRRSIRQVSEVDVTQAGTYTLHVEETLAISSKTGVITGHGLMKVDAAQVHIG